MTTAATIRTEALEDAGERQWYHTIELAPGQVTPGWFDTRPIVGQLPFPDSLQGQRCLDVGTFDGFWAFEMERRGADEVLAIDVLDPHRWDWPADSRPEVIAELAERKRGGNGFHAARAALDSSVEFRELSVYDLDPEIIGHFDFVYLGSLLLHLRDPVKALAQVRKVCRGRLLLVENIDFTLSLVPRVPLALFDGLGRPWWWRINLAGLRRMLISAGFQVLEEPRRIYVPAGAGHPRPDFTRDLIRNAEARRLLLTALKGDPHAVVLAGPDARACG